jgi:hypothetical protein
MDTKPTGLALLREPFPPNQISYLPKGGVKLAYVGHAALTDRLLNTDPTWTWEPLALDERGLPALDEIGGLWIKLTVLGVTRLGYGDAGNKKGGDAMKERIGDALRNAAMRFGAALELWHKGELHVEEEPEPARQRTGVAADVLATTPNALDDGVMADLRALAEEVVESFNAYGPQAAYERIAAEGLDDIKKIYLSTQMAPNVRNSITKYSRELHSKQAA